MRSPGSRAAGATYKTFASLPFSVSLQTVLQLYRYCISPRGETVELKQELVCVTFGQWTPADKSSDWLKQKSIWRVRNSYSPKLRYKHRKVSRVIKHNASFLFEVDWQIYIWKKEQKQVVIESWEGKYVFACCFFINYALALSGLSLKGSAVIHAYCCNEQRYTCLPTNCDFNLALWTNLLGCSVFWSEMHLLSWTYTQHAPTHTHIRIQAWYGHMVTDDLNI